MASRTGHEGFHAKFVKARCRVKWPRKRNIRTVSEDYFSSSENDQRDGMATNNTPSGISKGYMDVWTVWTDCSNERDDLKTLIELDDLIC